MQIVIGAVGIMLLIEASRRALGPALMVVRAVFLAYAYVGSAWLIPDIIEHKGLSFVSIVNAQWLDTTGVFGIPLGVSTSFVFLFGAILDKAGEGNYFIQIAFAGPGSLRGGPAKAAVVGSARTGPISGPSIANVLTTGTFTIPLMKRVGFSADVASLVNGPITLRVVARRPHLTMGAPNDWASACRRWRRSFRLARTICCRSSSSSVPDDRDAVAGQARLLRGSGHARHHRDPAPAEGALPGRGCRRRHPRGLRRPGRGADLRRAA